jgi:hypothetical protein
MFLSVGSTDTRITVSLLPNELQRIKEVTHEDYQNPEILEGVIDYLKAGE